MDRESERKLWALFLIIMAVFLVAAVREKSRIQAQAAADAALLPSLLCDSWENATQFGSFNTRCVIQSTDNVTLTRVNVESKLEVQDFDLRYYVNGTFRMRCANIVRQEAK